MKLSLKNKTYTVLSFEAASVIYEDIRDKSGHGASKFPEGEITDDNGNFIARISYNGRVWDSKKWFSGNQPIYVPRG